MGNHDVEPSAEIRQLAHFLREMHVALLEEGFSEKQALLILGQTLAAGMAANQSDDETP
jgi:hypothetical protein